MNRSIALLSSSTKERDNILEITLKFLGSPLLIRLRMSNPSAKSPNPINRSAFFSKNFNFADGLWLMCFLMSEYAFFNLLNVL